MNQVVKRPDSKKMRDAIFRLEDKLKELPQVEVEYIHRFAPGVYIREMIAPAGIMMTGAIHKTEHFSVFFEGKMIVPDGEGGSKTIEAPMIEVAKPGIKRAGYTLTDIRWFTIHATDETDVDTLEEMLTTNDVADVQHLIDQQDYEALGIPDADIEELKKIEVYEYRVDGLEIMDSLRHGKGVFATNAIKRGDMIAPGVQKGTLLVWSRYMNHSQCPNAKPVFKDGDAHFVALRDIEDEEITVDYRETHRIGWRSK